MGFGKKGKNSFTVHRSEEVLPGDITRELRSGGGVGGIGVGGGLSGAAGASGAGGSLGAGGGGLSRGSSSEADAIEQFFGDGAGGERCAQVQLSTLTIFSLSLLYCTLSYSTYYSTLCSQSYAISSFSVDYRFVTFFFWF